ncbi:MAG TPA: FAD:protein FMN transferase, partial [Vicinamibacterales bacterium]|nr:FAD:protein FMN transferase [Vicinamibacterales bacterium]
LRLSAWTADPDRAVQAFAEVFAEFDRLEALMTVWRDGSDISRLNAAAGRQPVPVSADTLAVLREARQMSEWSGGKFDVTFGALNDLWRFDHDQDNTVPDPAAVRARLPLIDYRALRIDEPPGTAFLARAGMRANLGGIGKGYAVDRGVDILRRRGFNDFMIQAGGDLFVAGRKDGRPWRLGIQDPRGPADRIFASIDLSDSTFSTSGDYERAFVKDGVRYHHILDPSTGEPARGCRSSTVLAPRAVLADGLSKMPFWLGPQKAIALYERLHVEAVIVDASNDVLITPGLKGRLQLLAAPTDAP